MFLLDMDEPFIIALPPTKESRPEEEPFGAPWPEEEPFRAPWAIDDGLAVLLTEGECPFEKFVGCRDALGSFLASAAPPSAKERPLVGLGSPAETFWQSSFPRSGKRSGG